jgi:cyclopropane-fatty-acyl-phospholipid synthase
MPITTQKAQQWSEQGYLPDRVIRLGIQRLLAERLIDIQHNNCGAMADEEYSFIQNMKEAPIALVPDRANDQHYEVPAEFFDLVLGKYRKYSCCYWSEETSSLDDAEKNALIETCQHAEIENGQDILELGCGWGSLSLWMAEN